MDCIVLGAECATADGEKVAEAWESKPGQAQKVLPAPLGRPSPVAEQYFVDIRAGLGVSLCSLLQC